MAIADGSRLRRRLKLAAGAAARLLYPPSCVFCGGSQSFADDGLLLCEGCREKLKPSGGAACLRCAAPAPRVAGMNDCPACRKRSLQFDSALAYGSYTGELREAVLRTKHAAEEPLAATMGRLLALHLAEQLRAIAPDVIVSIPMHWTRRFWRRTNGPELLAAELKKATSARFLPRLLVRRRRTLPQGDLSREERRRNLRGAFGVSRSYALNDARVLLVDDVLTTGATCSTAARALRKAGAKRVDVLVLARADH